MIEDPERCYRAVQSKDARFDGWIFVGVTSTGIYCRPSCPAVTPRRANVTFHATAAAAQHAGFRACKRCRPDATPGSPEWNMRADLVGRAMRLIADGVVDRDGVSGLATRLGYSERHVHRQLVAEVGAGPIALARAQRAQTARLLIETTELSFTTVAFAAGFASIRQFNDTVREVFASTPTHLRAARRSGQTSTPSGTIALRLAVRSPFDGEALLSFLDTRAIPGVEEVVAGTYRRVLRLPHGIGIVELTPHGSHVTCGLRLDDIRDMTTAVQRCRRLLDLDSDPGAISEVLEADPAMAPLVMKRPGLRMPGHVDGQELAVRAVLGQQVSVRGACTLAGRLAETLGVALPNPDGGLRWAFPDSESLATASDALLAMPNNRRQALRSICRALADETIVIDPGADRAALGASLVSLAGIGPWTANYIVMRALSDPDVFLDSDLGVQHGMERLGLPARPRAARCYAERWRPWRSYAVVHLWSSLS